jgi:hypothetical protein
VLGTENHLCNIIEVGLGFLLNRKLSIHICNFYPI